MGEKEEKEKEPFVFVKKIININGSKYVLLPKSCNIRLCEKAIIKAWKDRIEIVCEG